VKAILCHRQKVVRVPIRFHQTLSGMGFAEKQVPYLVCGGVREHNGPG
jgi:hypothetical protein